MQPSTLGEQLGLIGGVPQLTSLSLCDAASGALPASGLCHISKLTQLRELKLMVQSTGGGGGRCRRLFDAGFQGRRCYNVSMMQLLL
jgi:hypothetical protein